MSGRILVIAMSNIGADEIKSTIRDRVRDDAEVRVVAPASGLSRLDWLTNAEDDARADAGDRADRVAEAIPTDGVGSEIGDTDPVQAIEDALRTFQPDEIFVVTRTDDEATWLESGTADSARRRFDVPITHLVIR